MALVKQKIKNELKAFIVARLEILLGIRKKPTPASPEPVVERVVEETPFNETEVDFLKQLSYKGTKGQSATGLKTLANKPKAGLKSLNESVQTPASPVKKPAEPKKRRRRKTTTTAKKISTRGKSVKEIAVQDMQELKNRKPFDKMTNNEKAKEIARVNAKHARGSTLAKAANAVPPMTSDQLVAKYTAEQATRAATSQNEMTQFNNILASALAAQKN